MIRELVAQATPISMAIGGLLLTTLTFAAILAMTYRRRLAAHYQKLAQLPLQED